MTGRFSRAGSSIAKQPDASLTLWAPSAVACGVWIYIILQQSEICRRHRPPSDTSAADPHVSAHVRRRLHGRVAKPGMGQVADCCRQHHALGTDCARKKRK